MTQKIEKNYDFDALSEVVKQWAVMSQWEKDQEWYSELKESQINCWKTEIIEADDGSGDAILQFPDELIKIKGWREGTILNLSVEEQSTGNVLIITEKK
jgi:hypothetical protein